MADTKLTREELLGIAPIKTATKEGLKHKYTLGEPLVKPEQVNNLSTQMYRFHQWYMEQSANGREMFTARVKDTYYFYGEDDMWIHFKDIFKVY